MSTTPAIGAEATQFSGETLAYDVFVNEPPPRDGGLPNGEPRVFSPMASTLIYGVAAAVLTDPGMTAEQARALGDWVEAHARNVTDIFVTHGHGDHWFAAGLPAERFGARVVASAGTIGRCRVPSRRGRCSGTRSMTGSRRRRSPPSRCRTTASGSRVTTS